MNPRLTRNQSSTNLDPSPGLRWALIVLSKELCVGFDRRRLDVHRSDWERHGLLGLEELDTAVSHDGCEMLWSLDPADKYV